jgi:hypothetical protein
MYAHTRHEGKLTEWRADSSFAVLCSKRTCWAERRMTGWRCAMAAILAIAVVTMAASVNASTFNPRNEKQMFGWDIPTCCRYRYGHGVIQRNAMYMKCKTSLVAVPAQSGIIFHTANNVGKYKVAIQLFFGRIQISLRNHHQCVVLYPLPGKNYHFSSPVRAVSHTVCQSKLKPFLVSGWNKNGFKIEVYADSRGIANVFQPKNKLEIAPSVSSPFKQTPNFVSNGEPRPLFGQHGFSIDLVSFEGGFRGVRRSIGRTLIFLQSAYEQPGSKASNYRSYYSDRGLPKCKRLLPLRSLSGLPLGAQIVIFTLLGAALLGSSATAAACLLGLVYRDGPRRRWLCWTLIVLCTWAGASMYSLASMGDWKAIWGLCEFPGY